MANHAIGPEEGYYMYLRSKNSCCSVPLLLPIQPDSPHRLASTLLSLHMVVHPAALWHHHCCHDWLLVKRMYQVNRRRSSLSAQTCFALAQLLKPFDYMEQTYLRFASGTSEDYVIVQGHTLCEHRESWCNNMFYKSRDGYRNSIAAPICVSKGMKGSRRYLEFQGSKPN